MKCDLSSLQTILNFPADEENILGIRTPQHLKHFIAHAHFYCFIHFLSQQALDPQLCSPERM